MNDSPIDAGSALDVVFAYHERTKHDFGRYARGPAELDWATQPDPFLRYEGAPLIPLQWVPPGDEPPYEAAFVRGRVDPRPVDGRSIAQLFGDSLGLSAWKRAGPTRWSLRVNPSSGNLHPTEAYLLCGAVDGLTDAPMLAHFAPAELALERRTTLDASTWQHLAGQLSGEAVFVALTSIHWREAWKYGERGFRYCQHDLGHAIAAVGLAAAALGWGAALLEGVTTDDLARLLGLVGREGPEAEGAECLLAVGPNVGPTAMGPTPSIVIDPQTLERLACAPWLGTPKPLSVGHVSWPILDQVTAATRRVASDKPVPAPPRPLPPAMAVGDEPIAFRPLVHQRRSAVAFDGHTGITRDAFYQALQRTLPRAGQAPFDALPGAPLVDLVLFVHRVADLTPGIYCLVRDPRRRSALVAAMASKFQWAPAPAAPPDLALFRLIAGDARRVAARVSCHQDIAADGCFAIAMLAEFEGPLLAHGPSTYRRLFWECGMIGQVLYLEAEALGIRATGIGCFFDDPVHELLELAGPTFQSLYHFTVGGPIDDPRLEASPAYESLRHQEFPPYSYVPGQRARRPHPSRDPAGHAYGTPTPTPAPLDPSRWRHNPTYLRGLALFDRGYYWEAHEMFEALWVAAGRTGAVAELLQALVQLAAVGIKVRQGLGDAVIRLANAAAAHIARARKLAGDGQLAGLDLARLAAFADHVVRHGAQLHGSPDAAVEIVFAHRLEPAER